MTNILIYIAIAYLFCLAMPWFITWLETPSPNKEPDEKAEALKHWEELKLDDPDEKFRHSLPPEQ